MNKIQPTAGKATTNALQTIRERLGKVDGAKRFGLSKANIEALSDDWVVQMAGQLGLITLPPPLPSRSPTIAPAAPDPPLAPIVLTEWEPDHMGRVVRPQAVPVAIPFVRHQWRMRD